jgi:hypothetical protein
MDQQPEVNEPDGFVSSLISNGPSITVRASPLEVGGYEATGRIDCDQCSDTMTGVIDAEGTVNGVCPACGRCITDAGWIDRGRTAQSTVHEEVTAVPEQMRGI